MTSDHSAHQHKQFNLDKLLEQVRNRGSLGVRSPLDVPLG